MKRGGKVAGELIFVDDDGTAGDVHRRGERKHAGGIGNDGVGGFGSRREVEHLVGADGAVGYAGDSGGCGRIGGLKPICHVWTSNYLESQFSDWQIMR